MYLCCARPTLSIFLFGFDRFLCVQLVLWPKEHDEQLDGDNPDHITWLFERVRVQPRLYPAEQLYWLVKLSPRQRDCVCVGGGMKEGRMHIHAHTHTHTHTHHVCMRVFASPVWMAGAGAGGGVWHLRCNVSPDARSDQAHHPKRRVDECCHCK